MLKYLVFTIFVLEIIFCNDHSINFDGQNDFVVISDHAELDLTTNYTLEAWIFPKSFSWLAGIISKYQTNAANGYFLRLTNQAPYSGLGFDEVITGTGVLDVNQWHHIAAVNNNGVRTLYVDGVQQSISGASLNVSQNSDALKLGSDYSGRFFDGKIDEVRIWNTARAPDEIINYMDSTLTGSEEGLVAYYDFNEGSGIILNDLTGNGHNGTVVGGLWSSGYTLSGLLGDINFDGLMNVYDAVMLVAIMLGNEEGNEYQLYACDANQNGAIDIEDIVLLMQWILEIERSSYQSITDAQFQKYANFIAIKSDGDVAGMQIEFSKPTNISDMSFPSGWSIVQKGKSLVAYSLNGSTMPKSFKVDFENYTEIVDVKIVDWEGNSFQVKNNSFTQISRVEVTPNPFNSNCNISIELEKSAEVRLRLINIKGQFMEDIKLGFFNEGKHHINWSPGHLPSGTYFIETSDGTKSQFTKILYLK